MDSSSTAAATARPLGPAKLDAILHSLGSVAVAFSGGLDSRFLIHSALRAGVPVVALHARGPHIPQQEHEEALAWAQKNGVPIQVLALNPLALHAVAVNAKDRCYHCKRTLFSQLLVLAGDRVLCDGTNTSDSLGDRPGLRALQELGIRSPLAEAGLTKADIHSLAAATGMDAPDQPPHPCLLTRFAYDMPVTPALLAAADAAERAVSAALKDLGVNAEFRLRFEHSDVPALHVRLPELPASLHAALRAVLSEQGFSDAAILAVRDLSGYFDRPKAAAAPS